MGKIDVMLNMDDKSFADDLAKAIGVKKGDTVKFITPTFKRTDGRSITYRPTLVEEYDALKLMSSDNLKKVGCQIWDKENGMTHWLFPFEWYDCIPDGTEIISICGNVEKFKNGETDNDIRFGALAYGFIQQEH